jgi:hypothetical protein
VRWLLLILLVLSPAILYGIALMTVPLWRFRCPRCRRLGLKLLGSYVWDGRKRGGAVVFYECRRCRAHLKHDLKEYHDVGEEEWARFVSAP